MGAPAQPPPAQPDLRTRLRGLRRGPGGPLAGVCEGLGRATGLDPVLVRIAFIALATAGGAGIAIYVLAVIFVPREGDVPGGAVRAIARVNAKEAAGVGLLALSALLTLRGLGIWWSDAVVVPVVLTSAGVAVIWRQSAVGSARPARAAADPSYQRPISTPLGELPSMGPRLIGGAALVAGGAVALLQATDAIGTLRDLLIAGVVVVAGVTLIFGTSWFSLVASLRAERAERVRSQERAEMAAHLHDSVLQTLALIQRSAGEGSEAAALARRQERELRDWLAGRGGGDGATSLSAALHAMAAVVEADHRAHVEVVTVGDAELDERTLALVAAAREATVNAARHAGTGRVDVFAEAGGGRVEVFVRDRGTGFDPDAVAAERRGVRESIIGRMQRHGGQAYVRSSPGEGTEVRLVSG